jgi:hypothetical protein
MSNKMVGCSILLRASEMFRFLGQMIANVMPTDLGLVDIDQASQALREIYECLPAVYERVSA